MRVVRFETPWFRNGVVVYAAAADIPADGFAEQLIADGVAGEVVDVPDAAPTGDTASPSTTA